MLITRKKNKVTIKGGELGSSYTYVFVFDTTETAKEAKRKVTQLSHPQSFQEGCKILRDLGGKSEMFA